jgi:hypothetical protein
VARLVSAGWRVDVRSALLAKTWKEGLYLGTELPDEHPRVRAGVPLHGANLIPDDAVLPDFRRTVLEYIDQVTRLGHRVLEAIAASWGLTPDYFASRHTGYAADPLILFRIFLYPSRPVPADVGALYGVGEHTDYGLLTLLRQDTVGGLQVKTASGWIDPSEAAPVPAPLVCNIGDMLDRMTGGLYKSTPHRVRINTSGRDRLSFPLPRCPATPISTHASSRSARRKGMTRRRAGTARACITLTARTATMCWRRWRRWARCFRISSGTCFRETLNTSEAWRPMTDAAHSPARCSAA